MNSIIPGMVFGAIVGICVAWAGTRFTDNPWKHFGISAILIVSAVILFVGFK